jgi:cellulose synthase/poly-beta-1,6-N-acetylglucosamine synthase-like glycosyltransferase
MLPDLLAIPVVVAYVAVLGILFAYGLNFLVLAAIAVRTSETRPPARVPRRWPRVTVQLPVYNELYVVRRLIDAVCRIEYPGRSLEIQVLDDSTDETARIVADLVAHWRSRGVHIVHVRRADRVGFKAGALARGLASARGELVAIFDADFIPRPDFLVKTVPILCADPRLAFVQARWGHANREYSLLTRLQALSIDGHFAIEQPARWASGQPFNFNGTAGVWRRRALLDAGGWEHDTLTEDLDISYRAFLRGWRAAYIRDVEAPAELPVSFNAYRRQQSRWARGSFECAVKHLPRIWRSDLHPALKLSATLHLTGYSIHLLLLGLSLLYPLLLLVSGRFAAAFAPLAIVGVFNFTSLAPTLLFTIGQRQLGRRWARELPQILALSALGAGMMVNTARAAGQAFAGRPGAFERTPKFGLRQRHEDWPRLHYQLGVDPIVFAELALAGLNAWTCWAALGHGSWAIALYAAVFATGLAAAVTLTVGQTLQAALGARRARTEQGSEPPPVEAVSEPSA